MRVWNPSELKMQGEFAPTQRLFSTALHWMPTERLGRGKNREEASLMVQVWKRGRATTRGKTEGPPGCFSPWEKKAP